jgi:hypothetical protein
MNSQIDPLIPISGSEPGPSSDSVRLNFRRARDEINQLDSSKLPLNGGAMNGPLRFILPIAPPTMGVRSPGTRIVLYDLLGLGSVDYAIGVAAGTTWFSIPGGRFDWYCNEDVIATLDASGNFLVGGYVSLGRDPFDPNHAANLRYVDAAIAAIPPALPLTGGTLTGALAVTRALDLIPVQPTATRYGLWNDGAFLVLGVPGSPGTAIMSLAIHEGENSTWFNGVLGCESDLPVISLMTAKPGDPFVGLWNPGDGLHIGLTDEWGRPDTSIVTITAAGAQFELPVILPDDPTAPLEAATKQYVDDAIAALRAELRGG